MVGHTKVAGDWGYLLVLTVGVGFFVCYHQHKQEICSLHDTWRDCCNPRPARNVLGAIL